ncbi:MAG: methylcrotonoyl-CoA carboxylase [Deltaproteobacteria bacterium]|nr:methylcrotonoyl-CoA carboxylase [Deltaproteobacteria bacterium]
MPRLTSHVNPRSADFQRNREHMQGLLAELGERLAKARNAGGPKAAARLAQRGKLSPRERIERLLDRDGDFLEFSPLAAHGHYDDEAPGAGVITGVGRVSGRLVVISANDTRIKGGAIYPLGADKMIRAQQVARENGLPTVALVESAGANLLYQAELFAPGHRGGRGFCNQARMSAMGLPQIALVFGNATAGGAYVPGMSDYTVMVKGQAKVFLAGPPLVKAATGADTDDETLGGAEMHHTVSGLCDYLADDDAHAVALGRQIVANLSKPGHPVPRDAVEEPLYDPEDLLGIVPPDLKIPFDIREVMARLLDGSELDEFRPGYGPTLVCGFARISGFLVGVLGNNGPIFSESAQKAAHFIQLCCQKRCPIVYLQNITGFMVGVEAERRGIVKDGAKMVHAVATASVPQFTVLVGGSFGAGNYGMCGRAYDPRLLLTWPTSRIAVMGGDQAARVMRIVQEEAIRKLGGEPDAAEFAEMEAMVKAEFLRQSDPYFATSQLWDDGIIDPRHTRAALAVGLEAAWQRDVAAQPPAFGVFRM